MRSFDDQPYRELRGDFVLTSHFLLRCEERAIPVDVALQVMEAPFASIDAPDGENRWHFGTTRSGPGARWTWLKVVEGKRYGRRTLVTTYQLRRGQRSV